MYGFITHCWNPLGGKCFHDCSYCSSNRFRRYKAFDKKYSGMPRLIDKEFHGFGKDKVIFVCAQNDLFTPTVPKEYVVRVAKHCVDDNPENVYYFQTKNPKRYQDFMHYFELMLHKPTLCITLETNRYYKAIMRNAPKPDERVNDFCKLSTDNINKQVTIEPIVDFDLFTFLRKILRINPSQVNIGADSGGNNLPEPNPKKIKKLISKLEREGIRVWKKQNLERLGLKSH